MTLPPSNIHFVDAGGVSEKLCKIPDDFSKDRFLIDSRRADCKEFFWVLYEIASHFCFSALMTIKTRSTKNPILRPTRQM